MNSTIVCHGNELK